MILLPCLMRIKNIKNRGRFFTGPRLFYLEKHIYKTQYNSSFRTTSENLALLEWHWQIWLINTMFLILFQYSFEDDLLHALLLPLEQELQKTQHTYCGRIYKVFIKQLTKSIRDLSIRRTKERWLLQALLSRLSYWTDHCRRIFDARRSFLKKWYALICCYLKSALSSIENKMKIVIILGNYKLRVGNNDRTWLMKPHMYHTWAVPNLSTLVAWCRRGSMSGRHTHMGTVPLVWATGIQAFHSCKWSFVHKRRAIEQRALVLTCEAPLARAVGTCSHAQRLHSCDQKLLEKRVLVLACEAQLTQEEGICAHAQSSPCVSRECSHANFICMNGALPTSTLCSRALHSREWSLTRKHKCPPLVQVELHT